MAHVAPWAYPSGMTTTTDRVRQRVIDAVTMAALDGVDETEIAVLVSSGLDAAGRITDARRPVDWANVPTIGASMAM